MHKLPSLLWGESTSCWKSLQGTCADTYSLKAAFDCMFQLHYPYGQKGQSSQGRPESLHDTAQKHQSLGNQKEGFTVP